MKLVNYKLGYMFDCSIHGSIKMSFDEFIKVKKYLLATKTDKFWKSILVEDLQRVQAVKNGFMLNVRVDSTEKLVKHFGLSNYKRGNYILKVVLNYEKF